MIILCDVLTFISILMAIWISYESIHGYKISSTIYDKVTYSILLVSSILFSMIKRTDVINHMCVSISIIAYTRNIYNIILFAGLIRLIKWTSLRSDLES